MKNQLGKIQGGEKATAQLARLESAKSMAAVATESARAALRLALLAVEDGAPGAAAKLDEARRALSTAEQSERDSADILEGARDRFAQLLAAEKEKEENRHWLVAERLAKRRADLALEVEKDAEQLCSKVSELVKLGHELFTIAPAKAEANLVSSPLCPNQVLGAFRAHLQKLGWSWAYKWPWGVDGIPAFSSKVMEGNGWVMNRRPQLANDSKQNELSELFQ